LVQFGETLGGAELVSWIPSGWGLAAAVGFSIAGSLSDIFGRRYVILCGQAMTVVGGIVCATAQSMNQLIAGEVILGASIGTVSVPYAGISEILPNKYRGFGLAWTELNLAPWSIPSSLLAHQLVTFSSWRILYYLAIGYAAVSGIGTAVFYFPPSRPRAEGRTNWQLFKELDFIGLILFAGGLSVFLIGLNFGGNTFPWASANTLVPLILGAAVFVGSFIYDFMVPKNPLFPWELLRMWREFTNLLVLVFVAGMVSAP
jgi:MFS family permease